MKRLAVAWMLCVAGCHSVESTHQTTGKMPDKTLASIESKPHKARPKAAAPKAEVDKEARNLARAWRDQNAPPKVPPTARTIALFRRLRLGMARREVTARVGMPDKDVGSGIYRDLYKLRDGSTVLLGSNGNLIYAYHTLKSSKSGKSYALFHEAPRKSNGK